MATVQTSIIVLSCIIFFGRLFFGFFKNCSPFNAHADQFISDPSNSAQSAYGEVNGNGLNRISSSSNFSDLRVTETNETPTAAGMHKSESTCSLDPNLTNYKPKFAKSKNPRGSQVPSVNLIFYDGYYA